MTTAQTRSSLRVGAGVTIVPFLPAEKRYPLLRKYGYEAIEDGLPGVAKPDGSLDKARLPALAEKAETLRNLSAATGIEVHSLRIGITLRHSKHRNVCEALCDAAQRAGARCVMPIVLGYVEWDVPNPPDDIFAGYKGDLDFFAALRDTRENLERLIEIAAPFGLRVVLEQHTNMLPTGSLCAHLLYQGMNPKHVGSIVDLANMHLQGREHLMATFEILGDYAAYLHVKNFALTPVEKIEGNWIGGRHPIRDSFQNYKYTPCDLLEGYVNWKAAVGVLKLRNFQGALMDEDMQVTWRRAEIERDPDSFLARQRDNFQRLLACDPAPNRRINEDW